MGKRYLIDTNILLEYLSRILPSDAHNFVENIIVEDFNISIINYIEVLGHSSANQAIEDFMSLANTYQLDENITKQTISLRKIYKIKLPDAIIAATALVNNFIILSRNIKDFEKIADLEMFNPYES